MTLSVRGLRLLRALALFAAIAPVAWAAMTGATSPAGEPIAWPSAALPLVALLLALLHAASRDEGESSFGGEPRSFVLDRLTMLGCGASISLLLLFPAPFRWEAPRFLIFANLCLALFSYRRGIRFLLLSNAGLASIMAVILGGRPMAVLLPFGLGLIGVIACAQARDLLRRHNRFDLQLQLVLPAAILAALFAVFWAAFESLVPSWAPVLDGPGNRRRPAEPVSFTLLFAGLVALGLFWYLIRRRLRRAEARENPEEETLGAEDEAEGEGPLGARGIVRLYLGWLARLRAGGLGRRRAESPRDLKRRLARGEPAASPDLDEITELFERARYDSGEALGPEDARRAAEAVLRLQNLKPAVGNQDRGEGGA